MRTDINLDKEKRAKDAEWGNNQQTDKGGSHVCPKGMFGLSEWLFQVCACQSCFPRKEPPLTETAQVTSLAASRVKTRDNWD